MSKGTVAIIGAGIGGLACARYLRSQGFEPTLFESHSDLGGQWERHNPNSGVWPKLRINTVWFATKLSDVDFPTKVPMFPRNTEMLDMINAFVDKYEIRPLIRFNAEVTSLAQVPGGYELTWNGQGGSETARFDRAVVASGRYNDPDIPEIQGLDSFSGDCGVVHAFHYKQPELYQNKRILVLGGSISALEIASDLAMMTTERVHLSQRRQRYVMPKMIAGTPLEFFAFTREGAIAFRTADREELLAGTKEFLLTYGGNPASYGAPAPHEDMAKAGVTGSQHYLNLVAEDRIDVRPWVDSVDGSVVTFTDGSRAEVDAIVVGTGFNLRLPFLSDAIKQTVNYTRKGLDLSEFTFHPNLDGLAFVGLFAQLGPYPVVLEQQARYVAYTWGGAIPTPSRTDLEQGVAACIAEDHHGDYRQQHEMAVNFARLAGTDPADVGDPELQEIIDKSAVTGDMFRIVGTDALPDAADRVRQYFWTYGVPAVRADIAERYGRTTSGRPKAN